MRTFFTSSALNMTCQISRVLSLPVAMNSRPCSLPCICSKTEKWKSSGRSCDGTGLMIFPSLPSSSKESTWPGSCLTLRAFERLPSGNFHTGSTQSSLIPNCLVYCLGCKRGPSDVWWIEQNHLPDYHSTGCRCPAQMVLPGRMCCPQLLALAINGSDVYLSLKDCPWLTWDSKSSWRCLEATLPLGQGAASTQWLIWSKPVFLWARQLLCVIHTPELPVGAGWGQAFFPLKPVLLSSPSQPHQALLRCNWHVILYKFKVYNALLWYTYPHLSVS